MPLLRRILQLWVVMTCCTMCLGSDPTPAFDLAHPRFTAVLKRHVRDARVDYASLKAHPEELDAYLGEIRSVPRAEFKQWKESDQIAFLCNAYNAHTLRLILNHYPLKSIKDIGRPLKGPWAQKVVRLFDEVMTLDDLEHQVLRVDYAEPRIHFALVCAAKGCPPLRPEAYTGARLDAQLGDQARTFLAEAAKNRVDAENRTVFLSPIFKWYGRDFESKSGSVLGAIQPYWRAEWRSLPLEGYKVRYTDYDWTLNEQAK